MQKRLISVAAITLALCLSGPIAAQDTQAPDLNTVVSTVNGVEITLGHLAIARATLPEQYQSLPADVLFTGILDQLISQSALAQSYTGNLPQRITLALENEQRSLVAGEVVEAVMADAVTDDVLNQAYREQYLDAEKGEEYNAAHILVETEEAALEIQQELKDGAIFEALAREKSTGPSGPSGGNLGWFGTGMMVPSFEAAVIALEVGEVSDPVQTQFGWHVIKLIETRLVEAPALEEVRPQLEAEIREAAVQAHIKSLVDAADVDKSMTSGMDPSIINQINIFDRK